MSERDLLIERLEKKLVEKEKELAELKKMAYNREEIERVKEEIIAQIKAEMPDSIQKISELESKIVELRRAIESVINEVAYIKGEIKSLIEKKESDKKVKIEERAFYIPQSNDEQVVEEEGDDVIDSERRDRSKDEKEDEDGIIVCD
jgi:chromosome segregation ATPase